MAEEKQKTDSGTAETRTDKAVEGEKLSEEEIDAVAGGEFGLLSRSPCARSYLLRSFEEANQRYRNS